MSGNAVLAIVERAYKGAVEKQYFDSLYLAAELHRQLGGLDILLRGAAATYAVPAADTGALVLGGRAIDTLPDPRADLATLLDGGAAVFVERRGLSQHGLDAATPIHPDITVVDDGRVARHWLHYRSVFFL